MELRQLRSLIAVAEEAQFSRAATRLGISQPSLSVQIARLEGELGLRLFDRSSRRLQLTQAGELLLARARLVISEIADVSDELEGLRGLIAGRVVFGVTRTAGPCDLVGLLRRYHARYPGVDLLVREGLSFELAEQLRAGGLDLALLSEVPDRTWHGLDGTPIASEPLVAVLADDHPFSRRDHLCAQDLSQQTLISFPAGATIRETVERACAAAGFLPHVAIETTEVTRIRALAAGGIGLGVLPASDSVSPGPKVMIKPLTGSGWEFQVSLYQRRGRRLSPAARALLELATTDPRRLPASETSRRSSARRGRRA